LGFEVLQQGPATMSIAGTRQLFEEVFGAKLRTEKATMMADVETEFLATEAPLTMPEALANLIEGVAIAVPPEFYESPLPPLAPIDPAAYRYLFVPDEVGLIVNADRVHRLGATGKGVKVAMPDTGFYPHPFYNWHGYTVLSTVLGSGATDPSKDDVGHGTGEAANIFAIAPGATLIPVKMGNDPVGDFNKAVAQNPKVITNSWGYDVDTMTWAQLKAANLNLHNYLRALEAAVANAVAKGIVVCFSAGNGHRSFPGSHPDVISVGGVHVKYPFITFDDLEASSYASSFDSKLYPGRHVPDLCGLTGKKVTVGGGGKAPSIMLPVQPGCQLDGILPTTGAAKDGWGLFSGTSAASPQVAGGVALLLEKKPTLTPAQVKEILKKSATDVKTGTSSSGQPAGPGPDAATGAGLLNAKWAWLNVTAELIADYLEAAPDAQAAMLAAGQAPRFPRQFIEEMITALRSK
jgi:subtilisin family serine protease